MVRVLDLLEELMRAKKYKYERLDGSTSSSSRAAAVDRFIRKSCQRFVMLLSTRAGGLGLNLTGKAVLLRFHAFSIVAGTDHARFLPFTFLLCSCRHSHHF